MANQQLCATKHLGFFNQLRYGNTPQVTTYVKCWIKSTRLLEKYKNQRRFLYKCKDKNIFPQDIINRTKTFFTFENERIDKKFQRTLKYFRVKTLALLISNKNFEIKDLCKNIETLEEKITTTTSYQFLKNLKYNNFY